MERGPRGWQTRPVGAPLEHVLRTLDRALPGAGLHVVDRLELRRDAGRRSVLLLVDCPLLLIEALTLDRSAAVYFPQHVVVTGDARSTDVSWAHPAASTGRRMPAAVRGPVNALHERLTSVLMQPALWPDASSVPHIG